MASSALTGHIPMGRASARSSFMQLSNCYGSPLESRLSIVKMRHRLLYTLPSGHFSVLEKMGRLVGYYEQNRKGSYTPLDILPSNRNQVIRQKSLLIGCGGGFQQECSQQFSPVADWMGSVDLFLEDEGQQYGNMEEAATVARTPATCLEVWSGDHRQTPGGLKKSKAKAFRKKLTKSVGSSLLMILGTL